MFQSFLLFKWAKKRLGQGPPWHSKQKQHYLVIRLDNFVHFPEFFFLKVALFHLQSLYLFFLFITTFCGLCQIASLKIQTKNEILTLHIVEIRVGRCPTWLTNWKQKYLVIRLETLRYFPQFLLLHSLLATTAHNSCT